MCARLYGECRQRLMRKEHCAAGASRKPQHTAKIFSAGSKRRKAYEFNMLLTGPVMLCFGSDEKNP
jgi:hypothetical protein